MSGREPSPGGHEPREPRRVNPAEIDFKALYLKSEIGFRTADGWHLTITRYQPRAQEFAQPIFGEPILLVHGFSQNRHAWTAGDFAKRLLLFGADLHILELRGHGKSSIQRQKEALREEGIQLPADVDWGWDLDSYLLYDLPAAVAAVKRATGRSKIFYCGHSLGGILGYGHASLQDDLEGLIAIGSSSDLSRVFAPLRMLANFEPLISRNIDGALAALNLRNRASERISRWLGPQRAGRPGASGGLQPRRPRRPLKFNYVPMDALLSVFERALSSDAGYRNYLRLSRQLVLLSNPKRVDRDDIRWLLRRGGEKEPRRVVAQLAKWIRKREMRCYRTGFDFALGFEALELPMAIIIGDLDKLASTESTRSIHRSAKSHYLVSRGIRGNSHLELTMGHDIAEICADIKNLIVHSQERRPRRS